MEPVEINAGAWYLRALRADDRLALAELGETDARYTTQGAVAPGPGESDDAYSWAVAEPTTGELLAEIVLDIVTATVRSRKRRTSSAAPQNTRWVSSVDEIQGPISDASADQCDEMMDAKRADSVRNPRHNSSRFIEIRTRRVKSRFDDSC